MPDTAKIKDPVCAMPKTLHSQKNQKGKRHQKKKKKNKTQTTLMNIVAKFVKYALANQI